MQIRVQAGLFEKIKADALAIGVCEGARGIDQLIPPRMERLREIRPLLQRLAVRGKPNETATLPIQNRWVIVVGLGKRKEITIERLRQFAATAAKSARAHNHKSLALPLVIGGSVDTLADAAQAEAEGLLLALYRFDRLKTVPKEERKPLKTLILVVERANQLAEARRGLSKAQAITEAVSLVRDLVNAPANIVTPEYLAKQAKAIARGGGRLRCEVIPFAELKKRGFGGIVAVAQGSRQPAYFLVLDYHPPKPKATFVFAGKGITFDSGGLSLKSAERMERMKYDMAGGAAALGAVKAASRLKLPVRVVGLVAAAENLPSGTAVKPGDVIKTLSGKTVEVLNTDAEGRLVLSDCLDYAKRFRPDCVVDLATLTGACVVALGHEAIGLFTNDEQLAALLRRAGERTHERVWPLPLWDEYGELIKSDIADLKNVGPREGGAITAAKFLSEFAEGLRWAHLDIAGTAWTEKDRPYQPKGATGVGVRLAIAFIEQWLKKRRGK